MIVSRAILLSVISIALLSMPSIAGEQYLQVKVGVTEVPPFVTYDNNDSISGFVLDYYAELEKNSNLKFNFVRYESWDAIIQAIKASEVDILFVAQKNSERLAYLNFTNSFISIHNYLVVRNSLSINTQLSDLKGGNIAVEKSSAIEAYYKSNFASDYNFIAMEKSTDMIKAVTAKDVDAAILGYARTSHYMKSLDLESITIAGKAGFDYDLSIASRIDWPELNIYLDQAMKQVRPETIQSLEFKWGLIEPEPIDWQVFLINALIIVSLALISAYALIGNYRLKQEISKREEFEKALAQANASIQVERDSAMKEARTDPLTGVSNRREFEEYMVSEFAMFKRKHKQFSLMMLDLDFFKLINDEFGHDVGDEVLVSVTHLVNECIRPYDKVGRLGGEEFGIILPNTRFEEAATIAERIREVIKQYEKEEYPELSLTVSIGVTEVNVNDDPKNIIKRADEALYYSKDNGRDRVTVLS
ncbi:MAG: diguanylate cyclase [Kangiellaceae bacterium]|nr:diguanylate cyclase [Kangiellaceae bacterium]